MPTYDYRCSECGHRFEVVQSFHDAPIRECPVCERPDSVRKVYGNVGVVLKGSGFYRTDNRTSAGASGNSSKGADSGSSDKSSDSGAGTSDKKSTDKQSSDSGSSGSKPSSSDSKGSGSSGSSKAAAAS
jgi:putative FmdB family regulatory protein